MCFSKYDFQFFYYYFDLGAIRTLFQYVLNNECHLGTTHLDPREIQDLLFYGRGDLDNN
jgi:hypothetical protein